MSSVGARDAAAASLAAQAHPVPAARSGKGLLGAARAVALVGLAVAALAVATTTALWQVRSTFALPYWDQWSTVAEYFSFPAGRAGLRALLAQNNEHRILLARLVMFADLRFFGGRNAFNVAVIDAVQLTHLALIGAMGRALLLRSYAGAAVAALAACAMLSAAQYENIYWGFQSQFVMVYLFAAGAIACATGIRRGPGGRLALLGAALCAALASLSMANGLLVWPLLVAGSARRDPRAAAVLAALAAAVFALYLHGYTPVAAHTPMGAFVQRPGAAAAYALAYLGALPFPESVPRAQVAGAVILLALAALALRALRVRPGAAALFCWGNALFVLGSAAVTTLGRFDFGAIQALSPRYVTPGAVLWSAAALLALDAARTARARAAVAVAACLLVGMVTAVNQPPALARMDAHADKMRAATDAVLAGVTDPAALADLGASAPAIARVGAALAARRLSAFAAPEAGWIGRPIADSFTVEDDATCLGDVDEVRPLAPDASTGALVSGWAWDARGGRSPAEVVFADESGRVVGFGHGGAPRPDVPAAEPAVRSDRVGWAGFAGPGQRGDLGVYAVSEDGRAACRLRAPGPG